MLAGKFRRGDVDIQTERFQVLREVKNRHLTVSMSDQGRWKSPIRMQL